MRTTAAPDLAGRVARCSYSDCLSNVRVSRDRGQCGSIQYGEVPNGKRRAEAPSSFDLPFFEHRPDREYDDYYCGCWGWS